MSLLDPLIRFVLLEPQQSGQFTQFRGQLPRSTSTGSQGQGQQGQDHRVYVGSHPMFTGASQCTALFKLLLGGWVLHPIVKILTHVQEQALI